MPDYTTRVGNVEILALSDGSIRFTPDDFFPTIPAEAWDPYREYFTPEGEMIMNLGCFLLRSEGKTILIDTGLGIDTGHLDTLDKGKLLDDFSAKGISRDEVDVVGITHLHIDHVGWNFLYDDDGSVGQDSEVERGGEPRKPPSPTPATGSPTPTGASSHAAPSASARTSPRRCFPFRIRASWSCSKANGRSPAKSPRSQHPATPPATPAFS